MARAVAGVTKGVGAAIAAIIVDDQLCMLVIYLIWAVFSNFPYNRTAKLDFYSFFILHGITAFLRTAW